MKAWQTYQANWFLREVQSLKKLNVNGRFKIPMDIKLL